VLWSSARGDLGAFLTNRRFLVITTSVASWQVLPLNLDESEKSLALLSPYIALLVTGDRAVAFDAASDRFIEARLPIRDELFAAKAEKYVAVVITSCRAFGFATKTTAFVEFPLRGRESIEAVKTTSSKATIRTSDRLLTFEVRGATWYEHRLH